MLLFISSMIKTPIYIRVPVQHTKNLCFNFNFTPELMENIEDGLTLTSKKKFNRNEKWMATCSCWMRARLAADVLVGSGEKSKN